MNEMETGAPQTWRVVVEAAGGRASHEMKVTREPEAFGGFHLRAECTAVGGVARAATARQAVNRIAHLAGWDVVEILAPGEPSRATLAAEKERVANLLTDRLEDETEPLRWSSVSWDRARPGVLTLSVTEKRGTERSVVIPLEKVPSITAAAKVARASGGR